MYDINHIGLIVLRGHVTLMSLSWRPLILQDTDDFMAQKYDSVPSESVSDVT